MLNSNYKYKKIIYCVLLLLFFIIIFILIKLYFKPFFIIVLMVFLCTPLYELLCRFNVFSKKVNAVLSILVINIGIFFIIFYIGNCIYSKIGFVVESFTSLTANINDIVSSLGSILNLNIQDISNKISMQSSDFLSSSFIKKGAVYTTDGLFTFMIGIIATYFILLDKYAIVNHVKILVPEEKYSIIKNKIQDINKIIKIEIILVFITTLETILGFMALNIEHPIALGVVCGFMDILPYVGTIIIFIPLIISKIYLKQYIIACGLVVLYILLITIRQIMEFKFMSKKLNIHPLLIILSLYIGIKGFGFIGIFMGPLYVITAKEILES